MRIKRIIVLTVLIIVCFALQLTIVDKIKMGNAIPDVCLIVIVSIAYFNGPGYGTFFGFITGLLFDVFWGNFFGLYSILYLIIGYGCGLFNKTYYDYNFELKLPSALIIASSLFHNAAIYFMFYLLSNKSSFSYSLTNMIIPNTLYTLVIGVVLYRLLFSLDQKLSLNERRSNGYFVS